MQWDYGKCILKQLDYSPSFSTSDSQLGCASLTICSQKTRARSLIVKYHAQSHPIIVYYYSFKLFPLFWLVKTTRTIHLNQLLLTKFEENLCHIEPMTSKVQPAADYWTIDRKNLETRLCYFWWAEKQRAKWRSSFKNGVIFPMGNKAIIEFGFRRIRSIRLSFC